MCENYLISNHTGDIGTILESPEEEKCFSLSINFIELYESDTDLGNAVLTEPENSLKVWDKAVINVQLQLLKASSNYSLKSNVHCRIFNLPSWPHVSRAIFPGNGDANKFLQVTGIVLRISPRKLLEYQRQYFCAKCKFPMVVEAVYDKRNIIKKPTYCSNPAGCSSEYEPKAAIKLFYYCQFSGKNIVNFEEVDPKNYKDYQEIRIQEDLSQMGVGTMPNNLLVTLEDDLVNICKPGENVTITGIVKRRWSEFCIGGKIEIDIVLRATHVQVNNSSTFAEVSEDVQEFFKAFWKTHQANPLIGRNIILKSIAPEIYGLHLVKLAIAIVLAGGSQSSDPDSATGVEIRSNPHLLLIGDPGTGKSQILKFVSKIIPRTVLTTGIGSTSAGLTVAALMENGEWQLEAGALVMADGGLCCIDEFNSMKEHDRHCIHEAMEQQTISVAKAGIVCKLNTRCTILAACNPKGRMDPLQTLDFNCGISSPLLSRFDLILMLRDIVDEDNDRNLAEYIMEKSFLSIRGPNLWNVDKLQSYYALIRNLTPKLTKDAETILSAYYQLLRQFSYRNKSRTTVRLLESLIRLSQGHAKLMYHFEVHVVDALFAVLLADASSDSHASFLGLNLDNNWFSDNPQQLYWDVLETVLGKLQLYDIYEQEAQKRPPKEESSSNPESRALSSDGTRLTPLCSQSSENPSNSRIRKPFEDVQEPPGPFTQEETWLKSQVNELPVQRDLTQQPRMLFTPICLSQLIGRSQKSENPSTSKIRNPLEDEQERAQKTNLLKSRTSELPVQSDRIQQLCYLPEDNLFSNISRKISDDSKDSGNFSRLSAEGFNAEESIYNSCIRKENCSARTEEAALDRPNIELDSKDSPAKTRKSITLSEIVKSQRDMNLDLNIDFGADNNPVCKNAPNKAKKRRSNPASKTSNKCKKTNKTEDERSSLELLPSVNDDFSNILEQIDWDLEEPSGSTASLKRLEKMEIGASTSKSSGLSSTQICTKTTVQKDNKVFDFDLEDLHSPFESTNPFAGAKLRQLTNSEPTNLLKSKPMERDIDRTKQLFDLSDENSAIKVLRKTRDDSEDSGNFSRLSGEYFNAETSVNSSSLEKEKCRARTEEEELSGPKIQLDYSDFGLSVQSGTQHTECAKKTRKAMFLSELVKRQSDMDFDLNIDFGADGTSVSSIAPKKAAKRRSKPASKTNNKCKKSNKTEDERSSLELLPSVNDDFSNILEQIDWDLEEPSGSTASLKRLEKMEIVASTSKSSGLSSTRICTKTTVQKHNKVFDFDLDDLHSPFESTNPFARKKNL